MRQKYPRQHQYLEKIATLMQMNVCKTESPKGWHEGKESVRPDAMALLSRPEEWVAIIRWYTKLSSAIETAG